MEKIDDKKKLFSFVKFIRENLYKTLKNFSKIYFKYDGEVLNIYIESNSKYYLIYGSLDMEDEIIEEFFKENKGQTYSITSSDLFIFNDLLKNDCEQIEILNGELSFSTLKGNIVFKKDSYENEEKVLKLSKLLTNKIIGNSKDGIIKFYEGEKKILEILYKSVYSILSDEYEVNYSDDFSYASISDKFEVWKTKDKVKTLVPMSLSLTQIFKTL